MCSINLTYKVTFASWRELLLILCLNGNVSQSRKERKGKPKTTGSASLCGSVIKSGLGRISDEYHAETVQNH